MPPIAVTSEVPFMEIVPAEFIPKLTAPVASQVASTRLLEIVMSPCAKIVGDASSEVFVAITAEFNIDKSPYMT